MAKKATRKASQASKKAPTKTTRSRRQEAERIAAAKARSKEKQAGLYDQAMALFHSGDFAKAKPLFEQVIGGPMADMAHAARMRSRVCDQRLTNFELRLKTPDEHYDYAVTLINRRQLDPALEHLETALRDVPEAAHVHYAMALCLGLKGQLEAAAEQLDRAVALEPRNRTVARNDPDFQLFASAPAIKRILHPDSVE